MFEVDQKAFVLRIAFLSHLQEWRLSSNLGGLYDEESQRYGRSYDLTPIHTEAQTCLKAV